MEESKKYGARVYLLEEGVALIKQTIKSGTKFTDEYVVDDSHDEHHERHVHLDDDSDVADAIRQALSGEL